MGAANEEEIVSQRQFWALVVFFGSFLAAQVVVWMAFWGWLIWKGLT